MIRKALVSDLNNINELGCELDPLFKEKNNLEEYLNNDIYRIYVLVVENHINGFIMLTEMYETLELLYIIINKDLRHQGYGKELLNYAIQNKGSMVNKIMLEVRNNNETAITFYQNNGFNVLNIRKNYYDNGIDAIIMERSI